MSETELRRAAHACVETLTHRGRPHLAQRVGAQIEQLVRTGQTTQALALIALFEPAR